MKKIVFAMMILIFFSFIYAPKDKIKIYNHEKNKIIKMDLESYIENVAAAEMPASFDEEALKAQAVAARTYAMEKILSDWADPSHKGAKLCTSSAHCQGYKEGEHHEKIKNAVRSTKGELVLFEGKPIKAVYHSASRGFTKSSKDVWGGDLPYLKGVETPWDSVNPNYSTVTDTTCHGVGMSQWGAQGMAKAGYTYKEILKHYYTGVEVKKYKR